MRYEEFSLVLRELFSSDGWKGGSAILAGVLTLPWGQIAFFIAIIYNLHLIAGWWLDRSGWTERRKKRLRGQRQHQPLNEQNRKTD